VQTPDWKSVLDVATERALAHLTGLPERPVGARAGAAELRAALAGPLPATGVDPATVVADLAAGADPGIVASTGGRYFGFVIGGAVPASVGADWLASAWDQNSGGYAVSPAIMVIEETAAAWLVELLRLPADVSTGFVTGGQVANTVGLAAARHAVLRRTGWDVEVEGLVGAPRITVLAGDDRHATVDRALRLLGLGTGSVCRVATDAAGRMRPDALTAALAGATGPTIVATQFGEIHTGALDPVGELADIAHEHGAWVHVDGAIGLWARASRRLDELTAGLERADSWSTDGHKWLNVPYDCGIVFCADSAAHRASMSISADYLSISDDDTRDALDWNPELSRRARSVPVYAALRSLGSDGVAELVDRSCALARRFADGLRGTPGVEVLNDVVLNQVMVRFGDDDAVTDEVIRRVQEDGTCWVGGSTWRGERVMRISVVNWSTTRAMSTRAARRSCGASRRSPFPRDPPRCSAQQVGQLLRRVPQQLVPLGAVDGELRVVVPGVGRRQRGDRGAYVGCRLSVVDVHRRDPRQGHRLGQRDAGPGPEAGRDRAVGDVGGEHGAHGLRVGGLGEQA
jgi:glutamate/tyrosine decarboxylase-like PLP-dependent enzyme